VTEQQSSEMIVMDVFSREWNMATVTCFKFVIPDLVCNDW
jgi:hypothetical protein